MKVPSHIYGRAKVEVCGNCEIGATGFHFKNSTMVDVSEKSASVFIQTDRPVYKPGQQGMLEWNDTKGGIQDDTIILCKLCHA